MHNIQLPTASTKHNFPVKGCAVCLVLSNKNVLCSQICKLVFVPVKHIRQLQA